MGPDSWMLAAAVRVCPLLVRGSMRALVWVADRRGLTEPKAIEASPVEGGGGQS